MTIEELKKMTNDKILFSQFKDSLLIRSLFYRYADFLKVENIESVEKKSKTVVKISIPKGSAMGDHKISVDLNTGIVTADGKAYDELMPENIQKAISQNSEKPKKSSTTKFTPTINGFSIKSVQTMPSEDGYACYCKVYFNNKKIGDFVDKGDGGEYSFYADPPYSSSKIEKVIHSFPPTKRDYGLGLMEVPYDMNQMVNDLMEMKEISKELKKLEGSGKDYVLIDDWKSNKHLSASIPSSMSNEELYNVLKKDLLGKGIVSFESRRYRNNQELTVVNSFVCEDMLN